MPRSRRGGLVAISDIKHDDKSYPAGTPLSDMELPDDVQEELMSIGAIGETPPTPSEPEPQPGEPTPAEPQPEQPNA